MTKCASYVLQESVNSISEYIIKIQAQKKGEEEIRSKQHTAKVIVFSSVYCANFVSFSYSCTQRKFSSTNVDDNDPLLSSVNSTKVIRPKL